MCTEVVYRATDGYVDFPLCDIFGRRTLPAVEMVRYALSEAGSSQFEFICLLDGDESSSRAAWADAGVLAQSLDRPALTWLQSRRQ